MTAGGDSAPAIDRRLPAAVLATVLSRLDPRSLVAAGATSRFLRSCAAQALSFLPAFHLLDVGLDSGHLSLLLPSNPHLRSLYLNCEKLDDSAVMIITRASLHELALVNCNKLSGKLLRELGAKCRELRKLSLSSFCASWGLPLRFSDLEQLLVGCQHLESLSLGLDFSRFYDASFSDIWTCAKGKLTSLELSDITSTMLNDILMSSMESRSAINHAKAEGFFSRLQKMNITVDVISDALIELIANTLPDLTHLDIQDEPVGEPDASSDLTNAGLQHINLHGKLRHISLVRSQKFAFTYFRRVNDLGILLMAEKCVTLESICLGGFCRVTDTGFRAIVHSCPGLLELRVLHGNQLTDLVFHDISATSLGLTHVSLRCCNLLSSSGVSALSYNKDLAVLDLRDCRGVDDEAMKAICQLRKLQLLMLDGTDITDAGVSYLGRGRSPLVSLSVRSCRKLTNDFVPSLFGGGTMRVSLRALDLSKLPNISDDGIYLLARSRTPIVELRMRDCPRIGDASVMALASMQLDGGTHGSSLQLLDLYECGGITPLAFRWFKKPHFPRLRYLGVTGCLNRLMVDALAVCRPFLHVACRGEELGTMRVESYDHYQHDKDELDEFEQWLLGDDEGPSDADEIDE